MADYWVSQEKKFCEVCKCWMAGNKISIGIHENGNRHKLNVKKHLNDMTKKSNQISKQEKAVQNAIKQMNKGALNCMMKDLVNDPKSAQQYGVKLTETAKKEIEKKVASENKDKNSISSLNPADNTYDEDIGEWIEAKTEDGHTYYWNNVTRETSWVKPEPSAKKKLTQEQLEDKNRISSFINDKLEELGTKREDIVDKEEKPSESYLESPCKVDPYGSWKTVGPEKFPKLDLPKPATYVGPKIQIPEPRNEVVLDVSEKSVSNKRPTTSNSSKIVFKKPRQTSAIIRQKNRR